jgi:hypothetical protein
MIREILASCASRGITDGNFIKNLFSLDALLLCASHSRLTICKMDFVLGAGAVHGIWLEINETERRKMVKYLSARSH